MQYIILLLDQWDNILLLIVSLISPIAAEGRSARFDRPSGPFFLDDVGCNGTELRLTNCTNRGVGVHNCGSFEDAEVVCKGKLVK